MYTVKFNKDVTTDGYKFKKDQVANEQEYPLWAIRRMVELGHAERVDAKREKKNKTEIGDLDNG